MTIPPSGVYERPLYLLRCQADGPLKLRNAHTHFGLWSEFSTIPCPIDFSPAVITKSLRVRTVHTIRIWLKNCRITCGRDGYLMIGLRRSGRLWRSPQNNGMQWYFDASRKIGSGGPNGLVGRQYSSRTLLDIGQFPPPSLFTCENLCFHRSNLSAPLSILATAFPSLRNIKNSAVLFNPFSDAIRITDLFEYRSWSSVKNEHRIKRPTPLSQVIIRTPHLLFPCRL